jgi:predicted NUDIX family NTP pyrophosphohydrolase
MKKQSAGLVAYRINEGLPEVFIVHPGGPFFSKKDEGVWSIPKGLHETDEEPFEAAKREFQEETGFSVPEKPSYIDLGEIKRSDGKNIKAWAFESDFDVSKFSSNHFEMEWPPKSGKKQSFPEVDKGNWFALAEAVKKLQPAQGVFIERLANELHVLFGAEEIPEAPAQGSLF